MTIDLERAAVATVGGYVNQLQSLASSVTTALTTTAAIDATQFVENEAQNVLAVIGHEPETISGLALAAARREGAEAERRAALRAALPAEPPEWFLTLYSRYTSYQGAPRFWADLRANLLGEDASL